MEQALYGNQCGCYTLLNQLENTDDVGSVQVYAATQNKSGFMNFREAVQNNLEDK